MVGLLRRDDRSVSHQREVDPGVGHQVGLELCQIDVESSIKTQGGSDGGDDLPDEAIEVGVGRALYVEVATADVVDGLVVDHEGAVGMLEGGVSGQDGVVGLDNSSGDLNERKNNVKTMLKFAQLTKKMERVNEKNPKKQLIRLLRLAKILRKIIRQC